MTGQQFIPIPVPLAREAARILNGQPLNPKGAGEAETLERLIDLLAGRPQSVRDPMTRV